MVTQRDIKAFVDGFLDVLISYVSGYLGANTVIYIVEHNLLGIQPIARSSQTQATQTCHSNASHTEFNKTIAPVDSDHDVTWNGYVWFIVYFYSVAIAATVVVRYVLKEAKKWAINRVFPYSPYRDPVLIRIFARRVRVSRRA